MRAADVMRTSFATVKLSAPLIDAARLLLETNQPGLPVLDDEGRLVRIVTESDFLHRDELGVSPPCNWLEALLGIEEGGRVRERMRALRVSKIMTPDPLCVDEDATINDVVARNFAAPRRPRRQGSRNDQPLRIGRGSGTVYQSEQDQRRGRALIHRSEK